MESRSGRRSGQSARTSGDGRIAPIGKGVYDARGDADERLRSCFKRLVPKPHRQCSLQDDALVRGPLAKDPAWQFSPTRRRPS